MARRLYNMASHPFPIASILPGTDQKYSISADSSSGVTLTVTPASTNTTVSQYEVIRLVVDLDAATLYPTTDTACTVLVHFKLPGTTVPTVLSDYDKTFHMIPDPTVPYRFYLYFNEVLGRNMRIGELNSIYYNFQVYRDKTLCSQAISPTSTIQLYKTNLDSHYQPDDFANLFVALHAIKG